MDLVELATAKSPYNGRTRGTLELLLGVWCVIKPNHNQWDTAMHARIFSLPKKGYAERVGVRAM